MEISILDFINANLQNPFMDKIMIAITSMGNHGYIWILISAGLLMFKSTRKYGIMSLFALILTLVLCNFGLKNLVARPRPFTHFENINLLIPPPSDYSFPSGHSTSSFAVAVVITYMNKKAGICAIILASLIAFSRLYLYVHYPSDVIFGIILGIAFGFMAIYGYKAIAKEETTRLRR